MTYKRKASKITQNNRRQLYKKKLTLKYFSKCEFQSAYVRLVFESGSAAQSFQVMRNKLGSAQLKLVILEFSSSFELKIFL